jgi:hypothetical protein
MSSSRKFPPSKPAIHGLDANDPNDTPTPQPAQVQASPVEFKSPPASSSPVEKEYGRVAFAPICPHCTRNQGQEVRTVCKYTRGPMAYYYCQTPDCGFTVKHARPWREKLTRFTNDVNVAARPDMNP